MRILYCGRGQLSDHVVSCKSFSDAYTLISILLTDVKILEQFMKPDIIKDFTERWHKDPSKYDKYTFKISKVADLSKFKENGWIATKIGLYDDTQTIEKLSLKYEYAISICISKRTIHNNLDSLLNSFIEIRDDIVQHKKIP